MITSLLSNLTVTRVIVGGYACVIILGMLGGCETVKGIGKDITNVGETVQRQLP